MDTCATAYVVPALQFCLQSQLMAVSSWMVQLVIICFDFVPSVCTVWDMAHHVPEPALADEVAMDRNAVWVLLICR